MRSLLAVSWAVIFGWSLVAHPVAQGSAPDPLTSRMRSVIGAALYRSHAFAYVTALSDDVGPRLTGTPEDNQAIDWGLATMKAIGLENVRAEHFQIWRGWTRGSADAALVAPVRRRLMVDSMGWAGSTAPGGVDADVVPVDIGNLTVEMAKNSSTWAGKILLTTRNDPPVAANAVAEYMLYCQFLELAGRLHAAAVIGGQGGAQSEGVKLTHTGILRYRTYYDVPVVSMAAEDQSQLDRLVTAGKSVRVHIDVQNHVTDGPVDTANVVGEIRGTDFPDQVLVVGGHLDSWDLAQGATDNGCGVAITLAAAEAVLRSGQKPRRTLRFVLFSGEEQGLLGSLAYVERHKSEMANHLGGLIVDTGQGAVTGINVGGHDDLETPFERLTESLVAFNVTDVKTEPNFGTDTGPFILAGLPGMQLLQDRTPYEITHHSAADTLDKVPEDVLVRNSAIMAGVAFWIADRPERLATPWPATQTEKMLVDYKQDQVLKAFGYWPFGTP